MSTLRSSIALLCSTIAVAAGCSLIVAPDEGLIDGSGGSGAGTTNTGGGGGGPECATASECPAAPECEEATCDAGVCGTEPVAAGTAIATQTTGDCKETQCDGAGNSEIVNEDTDVPDDMEECTDNVCTAGVPSNPNKLIDTACGTGGALFCDGNGACVGCTDADQCPASDDCKTATCTAGVCGYSFTASGTLPIGMQTDGDCQTAGCDGNGASTTANDATDLPDDGNNCTEDLCTGTPLAPSNPDEDVNTPCGTNLFCDGNGTCIGCTIAADCGTDTTCQTFTCVNNACVTTNANASTVCTDGTFCNGTETCNGSGVCGSSTGDPCAANVGDADADCSESCDETADACTANDPNATACSDGSFCTGTETCTGGTCGGATGDPCAANLGDADNDCSEACNEATDACTANDSNGSSCNDGTFCNGTETCTGGTCGGATGNPCSAFLGDADSDCSEACDETADACTANDANGSACNDGTFCNGTETCTGGTCGGATGNPCSAFLGDADSDCSEACDETADACTANDANGSSCTDGTFCNGTETCTGGTCGSATGDPCAAFLGDSDSDCSEACDETADMCTANDGNGSSCTDGTFCNGTETCTGGTCGGASGDPCAAFLGDADGDCSEACNEGTDNCTANDSNGSSCTDGAFCNGTETCTGGACGGATGDPCAVNLGDADSDCSEACDETTDLCTANDMNGSACTDGAFCTGTDTCTGGTCGGGTDPCAANLGDADNDCSEACDETADMCTANDANGSACTDGAFCNGGETCTGGACGTSAGDPCAANLGDADNDCSEACDEAVDMCTANDADASSCSDGLFCTGTETCTTGTCGGSTGDPCPLDGDANCADACNEAGDACTSNTSMGAACTDAFTCTSTETCNGTGACSAGTLFFSEYVEGSATNKAVEIFNPTGAAINLATSTCVVNLYLNGSATISDANPLTGVIAAGGVHVLCDDSAGATLLAACTGAGESTPSLLFTGNDAVELVCNGITLDVIGQIGVDPGEWGTGVQSTQDNTLQRNTSIFSGDTNGGNAFDPATEWQGFNQDTFSGIGSHTLCP